jgi:hypothetical protein
MDGRAARVFGWSLLLVLAAFGAVRSPASSGAHGARAHSLSEAYAASLWPKVNGVATVYYVIDANSDSSATPAIDQAIATFNADFPGIVQWVKWTSASSQGPNYVDIDLAKSNTSGQCEATEGYQAVAAQAMGGSGTCTVGTILHEMGHVIGLWHEQARPDSASFVTIEYGNVIKGSWSYFEPPLDNVQTLASYDYASLMQYPPFAFSRNGGPVIESIPAGIPLGGEGVPGPAKYDYSAGDKETIERLYGAAPTKVTVTSNPVGLTVSVDGSAITTPHTYAWTLNSTHTLAVASGVQTLSGDIAQSTTKTTFYYTYGRWSDSTAASHTITIKPGNGELAFPATSPAIATYSANFIQLVPYSAAVSPANSGQVSASPAPTSYPGAAGTFYTARHAVTLTAQPASSWAFYAFNNAPFYLPGPLGLNPKMFYVPDTGNPIATTVEFADMPVYTVTLSNNHPTSNLSLYVDGTFEYAPKNYSPEYDAKWTANSTHTLTFDSPEYPYSIDSRYAFASWAPVVTPSPAAAFSRFPGAYRARRSRAFLPAFGTAPRPRSVKLANGTNSETITLPGTSATYEANLTPEFMPVTNFGYPPCGGSATLSPASPTGDGYYPYGQKLTFAATAGSGWTFAGWTFDLTGTASPASLTATGETLVFANFNTAAVPLALGSLSPASVVAGAASFTLTLTGKGFAAGSLVTFDGTYLPVDEVSSTELRVTVPAALVATAGNYQVAVENFPQGSTGCAVFGYAPFFVKT